MQKIKIRRIAKMRRICFFIHSESLPLLFINIACGWRTIYYSEQLFLLFHNVIQKFYAPPFDGLFLYLIVSPREEKSPCGN